MARRDRRYTTMDQRSVLRHAYIPDFTRSGGRQGDIGSAAYGLGVRCSPVNLLLRVMMMGFYPAAGHEGTMVCIFTLIGSYCLRHVILFHNHHRRRTHMGSSIHFAYIPPTIAGMGLLAYRGRYLAPVHWRLCSPCSRLRGNHGRCPVLFQRLWLSALLLPME